MTCSLYFIASSQLLNVFFILLYFIASSQLLNVFFILLYLTCSYSCHHHMLFHHNLRIHHSLVQLKFPNTSLTIFFNVLGHAKRFRIIYSLYIYTNNFDQPGVAICSACESCTLMLNAPTFFLLSSLMARCA